MNLLMLLLAQAVGEALAHRAETDCETRDTDSICKILAGRSLLEMTPGVQQMLFTLEALIYVNEGKCGYQRAFLSSYSQWAMAQTGQPSGTGLPSIALMRPKPTVPKEQIQALMEMRQRMGHPSNQNRGAWAVTRIVPLLSLMGQYQKDLVQSIAYAAASLSDGHDEVRSAVCELVDSVEPISMARAPKSFTPYQKVVNETRSIDHLGEGETARSAVLMAMWCVAQAENFSEAMIWALCRGGPLQSVAGLTSVLWYCKKDMAPSRALIERLEHKELIELLFKRYQNSKLRRPRQRV